jgi:hypothetical protein
VGDAVKLFPFLIECKNDDLWTLESFFSRPLKSTLYGYWRKIKREASVTDFSPALCFKRFGTPAFWMCEKHVAGRALLQARDYMPSFLIQYTVDRECLTVMLLDEFLPLWVKYTEQCPTTS